MDRNPGSPWNPLAATQITPAEFEKVVLSWLRRAAEDEGRAITTEHLGVAEGEGGSYKIDVPISFTAFEGARFVVLIECKHQRRPVEREDVMVLEAKLRDVNAQKAMLFSTSGFQSGALEFATVKGIATVTVVEGASLYETRALGSRPVTPPPWVKLDPYAGLRLTKIATGISAHTIDITHLDAVREFMEEPSATSGPTKG